jgi:hypothetical protein
MNVKLVIFRGCLLNLKGKNIIVGYKDDEKYHDWYNNVINLHEINLVYIKQLKNNTQREKYRKYMRNIVSKLKQNCFLSFNLDVFNFSIEELIENSVQLNSILNDIEEFKLLDIEIFLSYCCRFMKNNNSTGDIKKKERIYTMIIILNYYLDNLL